ncbi:helix-turn-helix domain-containing protein [Methylobacterium komagatae]|uniref:Helix-turn-helix domain-containing protein n=1 Tax=Methylobacterium komagatae TaxID=374425 RepID=A0ABW2BR59_9HYPH
MTPDKLHLASRLLGEGKGRAEVAVLVGVSKSTLWRALKMKSA